MNKQKLKGLWIPVEILLNEQLSDNVAKRVSNIVNPDMIKSKKIFV